jgi:hypothetical protein
MFHGEKCNLTRKEKRNGTSSQNAREMQRKTIIGSTGGFNTIPPQVRFSLA